MKIVKSTLIRRVVVVVGLCLSATAVAIAIDSSGEGARSPISDQFAAAPAQLAGPELSPSPLGGFAVVRPNKMLIKGQENVRSQDRAKIVIGDKLPRTPSFDQLKASSQKFKFQHTGGTQQ